MWHDWPVEKHARTHAHTHAHTHARALSLGCAEANHLHRVALLPTAGSLDVVYLTLVVNISKGAGCVVHRAEVTEEMPQARRLSRRHDPSAELVKVF